MRRRRENRPVGEETEQRRKAPSQGWAAMARTGGWRRWPGPVGRKERDEGARETMRKNKKAMGRDLFLLTGNDGSLG
jgi:hypothetical protein